MTRNRAARGSGNFARAKSVAETRSIVANQDMAMLVAGLVFAVSFGAMFIWAAVMW